MAGVLLHHTTHAGLLGIATGESGDEVAVTVQQDAAYIYKSSTQRQQHFVVLGASQLEFAAPVAFDSAQQAYTAAIKDQHTRSTFLVTCTPSDTTPTPSLANSGPRLLLDGDVFSLHALQPPSAARAAAGGRKESSRSNVAVVMKDGRVGIPNWEALNLTPTSSPSSQPTTTRATAHHATTLCVATQPHPGQPATLCVFNLNPSSTTTKLTLTTTLNVPPSSSSSSLLALSCSTTHALCFWSDNTLSCFPLKNTHSHSTTSPIPTPATKHLQYNIPGRSIQAPATALPNDPTSAMNATPANNGKTSVADGPANNGKTGGPDGPANNGSASKPGTPGSNPTNGSTPNSTKASRKKRKNSSSTPEAPSQPTTTSSPPNPIPACTAVSETQFVLLAPATSSQSGDGPALLYAVVNARYGRVQCHKILQLDSSPGLGARTGAGRSHSSHHAMCLPGGTVVVPVGSHVVQAQLDIPTPGLAALVGASAGREATLGSNSVNTSTQQSAQGGTQRAVHGQGDSNLLVWAGVRASTEGVVVSSLDMEQLMLEHLGTGLGEELELVGDDEGVTEEGEEQAYSQQLLERLASGGDAATLEEACGFVLQCTEAGKGCATALPYITAEGLARLELWEDLDRLLTGCPLTSLACTTDLVPTLLTSQQYHTLGTLLRSVTDMNYSLLAQILRHYTSSSKKLRSGRVEFLQRAMGAAETFVAAAEKAPSKVKLRTRARCAAAVVSGFTPAEVVLNLLVACPMDPSILALAMSGLPASQVLLLLRYLSKWTHKYQHQLPDGAEHVSLPPVLHFPSFAQVLDWLLALLDVHLTKISWSSDAQELLTSTRASVDACVRTSQRLIPLSGVMDHVKSGAQLPRFNMLPPSMYTVELLNLTVGRQEGYNDGTAAGGAGGGAAGAAGGAGVKTPVGKGSAP